MYIILSYTEISQRLYRIFYDNIDIIIDQKIKRSVHAYTYVHVKDTTNILATDTSSGTLVANRKIMQQPLSRHKGNTWQPVQPRGCFWFMIKRNRSKNIYIQRTYGLLKMVKCTSSILAAFLIKSKFPFKLFYVLLQLIFFSLHKNK